MWFVVYNNLNKLAQIDQTLQRQTKIIDGKYLPDENLICCLMTSFNYNCVNLLYDCNMIATSDVQLHYMIGYIQLIYTATSVLTSTCIWTLPKFAHCKYHVIVKQIPEVRIWLLYYALKLYVQYFIQKYLY
jgi:hypothetical protein